MSNSSSRNLYLIPPEAIEEMRKRGSPLGGSVSPEAAKYGPRLTHLGLAILPGETVQAYNYIYIAHKLVNPLSLSKSSRTGKFAAASATSNKKKVRLKPFFA